MVGAIPRRVELVKASLVTSAVVMIRGPYQ